MLIHKLIPNCDQWRFWSDCENAQADLNLRWSHMPKGTFSNVSVHMFVVCLNFHRILSVKAKKCNSTLWTSFISCYLVFVVLLFLMDPVWHCYKLGEEGTACFTFLWFVVCVMSVMGCLFFRLVSSEVYVLRFWLFLESGPLLYSFSGLLYLLQIWPETGKTKRFKNCWHRHEHFEYFMFFFFFFFFFFLCVCVCFLFFFPKDFRIQLKVFVMPENSLQSIQTTQHVMSGSVIPSQHST